MSKQCTICGKKTIFGNRVSHSNRKTRRKWMPNLQPMRVPTGGGNTRKIMVCTGCRSKAIMSQGV